MNPDPDAAQDERPIRFSVTFAHIAAAAVALGGAFVFDTIVRTRDYGSGLTLAMGSRLAAYAHAIALVLPFAIGYGIAIGIVGAFAPQTMRRIGRITSLRTLLSPDPETFADAFSSIFGIVVAIVGLGVGAYRIIEALHSPLVMAAAIGVLGPVMVAVGRALTRILERPLRAFARGLDGVACPAVLIAVITEFAIAGLYRLGEVAPAVDRAISWTTVRTGAIFVLVEIVIASTLLQTSVGARRARWLGALVFVASVAASTTSILTYGRTTSQRFFVEEVSLGGSLAYRFWSEILDRDGDGYPALLGGRDCDDSRASIHPDAIDTPGDHIDADCFGGDGTPRFDDREVMRSRTTLGHVATPNILLVSVDTMRPDRLALFGEHRHVAPRLDQLSRESVVFAHAESSSPRTTRSMPAIFTGQHPGSLAYDRSLNQLDLSRNADTIAERISDRYETAAVLGTSYFRTTPNVLQGFSFVDHAGPVKPDPDWATDRAITWLTSGRATAKPFFLWVHYFAPHEPYLADQFPSRFGNDPAGQYDTEIWRADREVGRLLDHLQSRGLDRDTVVIVFSDHGESLGEHGAWGHSTRLTEDQIHSVLMIRATGYPHRVVETPVALFDIAPTVFDLTGTFVTTPMSARNLTGLMRGSDDGLRDRPLFAEILPDAVYAIDTQSVRVRNDKLIFFPRSGRMALYDLGVDPHEDRDIADRRPGRATALREMLLEWDVASHRSENRVAQMIHDAHVAALPSDAIRLDAHFANGVTLVGAKIVGREFSIDGLMRADLYFRADRPITEDCFIHVTFEPEDPAVVGGIIAAHHTAIDGSYPARLWRPGQIFRDTVVLRVPVHARREKQYVGFVELWSHFHVRLPIAVEQAGSSNGERVRFGSFTIR